jgi:hypothetical protein
MVGGSISASPGDDMADVRKRLLSPDARGLRVLLLDNVKSLRFSWDELERLITSPVISGRRMYHGEGRMPNTFTTAITLNGASLSKDLAQRCIPIELARPTYSAEWLEETIAFIDANRWAILGDLIAILKQPAPKLSRFSRWGEWEALVLARLPEPADAQRVIEERQDSIDDDAEESELIREAFAAELRRRGHDPERDNVFIPAQVAATIVNTATNEKRPTNKTSGYLKALAITGLRKSKRDGERGWGWFGPNAEGTAMEPLGNAVPWDGSGAILGR